MAEIGSWNGFIFEVSPSIVRGFTGLTIEGGSETENKVSDKYAYVQRKNSTPTAVNLDIYLNAYLGCSVRDEAMAFIKAATNGDKNYFYVGGKKLLSCQLMLVNAKVTETVMTPGGEWTSCKISLTMNQCEKYSEGSTGSSGGTSSQPKKDSVKQETWTQKAVSAVKETGETVKQAAKSLASKAAELMAKVPSSLKTTKDATTQKAEAKIASTVSSALKSVTAGKTATSTAKAAQIKSKASAAAAGKITALKK